MKLAGMSLLPWVHYIDHNCPTRRKAEEPE